MVGSAVYCDCCQCELMAKLNGTGIEIRDGRHGVKHHVIIQEMAMLSHFAGTTSEAGILTHVRRIFGKS